MSDKIKWFEAALAEKLPDTTLEELSTSLRQDLATLTTYLEEGTGLNPFTANVLVGILGSSPEEFMEYGRRLAEGDLETSAPEAEIPHQVELLVKKARDIFQEGGQNAVTLSHIISLLKP